MSDYVIRCGEDGDEVFIDARYPEYSIEWKEKTSTWEFSLRMSRYNKWEENKPMTPSSDVYKFLLVHFGLGDFSSELVADEVCRMSPLELKILSEKYSL